MILGPVLCLPHDPRWGRVEETYGEDPYLDALNGVAMVKGLQGKSLNDNNAVIAEPKHFSSLTHPLKKTIAPRADFRQKDSFDLQGHRKD